MKHGVGKRVAATGQREHLDGEADDGSGLLALHMPKGLGGIDGGSMRNGDDAGAGDAPGQLIADPAFSLAGKRNDHAVAGSSHGGHAMRKELQREFLVRLGEEDALPRSGCATGVERDNTADVVLRDAEEFRGALRKVLGPRQRNPRDLIESAGQIASKLRKALGIKRAVIARPRHGFTERGQLVMLDGVAGEGGGGNGKALSDPTFQRRPFDTDCGWAHEAAPRQRLPVEWGLYKVSPRTPVKLYAHKGTSFRSGLST